jgi:VWFA-related protein
MAVTDLDASNFSIFVDGELQTPVDVKLSTTPISVCLVLDYSGSMSNAAIEALEEAAKIFVRNMYHDDYGEIIKFSIDIEIMQIFTGNKDALIDAIAERPDFPRVSTCLYDAIYQAITDTAEQTNNRAVIAMSDGDDNHSQKSISEVIEHATLNDVTVFTIGLDDKIDANDLRIIAEQTGGVYYESPTPDDLAAIYQALSIILKNQYQVTFETTVCDPNNLDNIEHDLEIVVNSDNFYGKDSEIFICPPECNLDINSDDDIDEN